MFNAGPFDPNAGAPTYAVASWLFLRLLGLTYAVAFLSLGLQIKALVGSRGLLPLAEVLGRPELRSVRRFLSVPTLFWWNASDRALVLVCGGGFGLSLALICGLAPVPVLALLWLFYLSLVNVGRTFLNYQWDSLLLETGFLAIFIAPLEWLPSLPPATDAPLISRWLLYWLLFRLMFTSGLAKLVNGDRSWRDLTALCLHYETQPLPNRIAWHVHQLPRWFHRMSAAMMFFIEMILPWLIFAPAPLRCIAGAGTVGLMLLIAATGSYCFFNLNTVALAVLLFDDATLARCVNCLLPGTFADMPAVSSAGWPVWLLAPLAVWLGSLSLIVLAGQFRQSSPPPLLRQWHRIFAPYHLANAYGLFSIMSRWRNEIIIQGSDDRRTWQDYEFRWKPGDLRRVLRYAAPHQPRLDWQMWFAALQSPRSNPWFTSLLERLLRGEPAVLALMRHNPFPDHPPRYIRAMLYQYWFTDRATRKKTGEWWRRELRGIYCATQTLNSNGVMEVVR